MVVHGDDELNEDTGVADAVIYLRTYFLMANIVIPLWRVSVHICSCCYEYYAIERLAAVVLPGHDEYWQCAVALYLRIGWLSPR